MTDPVQWTEKRKNRIGALFDLLANSPDGLTIHQIADGLDIPLMRARQAVHDLRIVLGEDDEINVTATPNGHRKPWIYELTGNMEKARPWLTNRATDLESRLETIEAVAASLTQATKPRTIEGRKARKIHRTISYLRRELADIADED